MRAHCVYCAMGGKGGTNTHFQVRLVLICAGLARRDAGCAGGVVGLALVVCLKLGRGRSECSVRTLVGVCAGFALGWHLGHLLFVLRILRAAELL